LLIGPTADQWLYTSPLSIPIISIALHERLDDLIDPGSSSLELLSYHYGPKYFTCGFLGCQFRRFGFETKTGRQAHEKYHQKPWNCNYPGCRYATQGFISRKMRDDHLKNGHSHVADPDLPDPAPLEKLEDEEIQPLMFDLIESNQVNIITSLIPRLDNLKHSVQRELPNYAARMGASSILQLFHDCGLLTRAFSINNELEWNQWTCIRSLVQEAVRSGGVSSSKVLLCWITALHLRVEDKFFFRIAVSNIIATIIDSESEDLFGLWRPILGSGFGIADSTVAVAQAFASQAAFSTTDNIPNRERMLLAIWEEYKVLDTITARDRNRIIPKIADSTCSINLTQYALNHGCQADVDFVDQHHGKGQHGFDRG
jgi:hypothetical protein